MRKAIFFAFVALALMGTRANGAELITNGGFENATPFFGWSRVNSPSPWWALQNTTASFGGGFLSVGLTTVVEGTKNAWNGMTDHVTSNSQWQLYQDFTIPADRVVRVTWRDRYQINHTQFCPAGACQPKFYYVEIVNPANSAVLQTLHTQSTIGNINQDTGWVFRSADIVFPGQTVSLRFRGTESVPLTGPGQIEIDAVSAQDIAPTAANVSLGGNIRTAEGLGIRNGIVTLTDSQGVSQSTVTGSLGAYRFDGVEVGQTYTISVSARKFYFMNPARIISVKESVSDVDFVALE